MTASIAPGSDLQGGAGARPEAAGVGPEDKVSCTPVAKVDGYTCSYDPGYPIRSLTPCTGVADRQRRLPPFADRRDLNSAQRDARLPGAILKAIVAANRLGHSASDARQGRSGSGLLKMSSARGAGGIFYPWDVMWSFASASSGSDRSVATGQEVRGLVRGRRYHHDRSGRVLGPCSLHLSE